MCGRICVKTRGQAVAKVECVCIPSARSSVTFFTSVPTAYCGSWLHHSVCQIAIWDVRVQLAKSFFYHYHPK